MVYMIAGNKIHKYFSQHKKYVYSPLSLNSRQYFPHSGITFKFHHLKLVYLSLYYFQTEQQKLGYRYIYVRAIQSLKCLVVSYLESCSSKDCTHELHQHELQDSWATHHLCHPFLTYHTGPQGPTFSSSNHGPAAPCCVNTLGYEPLHHPWAIPCHPSPPPRVGAGRKIPETLGRAAARATEQVVATWEPGDQKLTLWQGMHICPLYFCSSTGVTSAHGLDYSVHLACSGQFSH